MVESVSDAGKMNTGNPFDDRVGPFWDTAGLVIRLGRTETELAALVDSGDLLCVSSGDGQRMYPDYQFDTDGSLLPFLPQVLTGLCENDRSNAWRTAIWLNSRREDLNKMTAARAIRAGQGEKVLLMAGHAGAALY